MRRIRGRKEVFMATMKDIITSPLLLAMVIIGLLYIVGFSLVYLKKAYTHWEQSGAGGVFPLSAHFPMSR